MRKTKMNLKIQNKKEMNVVQDGLPFVRSSLIKFESKFRDIFQKLETLTEICTHFVSLRMFPVISETRKKILLSDHSL